MNVLQLLTTIDVDRMVEFHNQHYETTDLTSEFYRNTAIPHFINKALVKNTNVITVDFYQTRHDDPEDDTNEYHVGLDCNGEPYSMSFVPWGEVLASQYRCGMDIPEHEIAAHIFWELTWHGWEEEMQEVSDDLADRVEDLERTLARHDEKVTSGEVQEGSMPEGSSSMDDVMKRMGVLRDADYEARVEKMIANMRTERVFINGVEQPRKFPNA